MEEQFVPIDNEGHPMRYGGRDNTFYSLYTGETYDANTGEYGYDETLLTEGETTEIGLIEYMIGDLNLEESTMPYRGRQEDSTRYLGEEDRFRYTFEEEHDSIFDYTFTDDAGMYDNFESNSSNNELDLFDALIFYSEDNDEPDW